MNSADSCHEVSGCPGLFVDAFRGHFLRDHTKNPDATFILSHYHGDHYQNLPRDGRYTGPAKIHCTPVTARLLINVHDVHESFVVEHQYGATFKHPIFRHLRNEKHKTRNDPISYANVTFYDANHCPGACIILIELPDGKTTHLHTGDMRYSKTKFESYPLLTRSIKERRLDLVYLDTTYCHPKHDFITQDEAVDSIASQTQELLSVKNSEKTLVLLSCYSIGKEKVLHEASKRSKQLIYVNEKKWRMLQCIRHDQLRGRFDCKNRDGSSSFVCEEHTNILEKCTRDSSLSDLHVIPMGLAGEMFPYFQPSFQKIAKYVEDLSSEGFMTAGKDKGKSITESKASQKEYDRVVAFIPTGWANSSNWNKKNAISIKKVELSCSRILHVEVRLISYSEHSTFPELVSFVQYLKPRKIIPTVFSDENHKRQIEGRFRNFLDSTRAKQAFFRSMTQKKDTTTPTSAVIATRQDLNTCVSENIDGLSGTIKVDETTKVGLSAAMAQPGKHTALLVGRDEREPKCVEDDEIQVLGVIQGKNSPCLTTSQNSKMTNQRVYEDEIQTITSMGFDRGHAKVVLEKYNGNLQEAMNEILSSGTEPNSDDNELSKHCQQVIGSNVRFKTSSVLKKRKISDFFFQKK